MALNKKQTSLVTKIVLVFLAIVFVLSFAPGLFMSGGNSTSATEATGALDVAAQQYAPSAAYYNQFLASEPTSYTVLLNLGYTYHDWAAEVQNSTSGATGADIPLWVAATSYYERALAVEDVDPGVRTDLAISYFYGGDTARAIVNVEKVMVESPEFGPAFFNAGIFYRAAGRDADALRVLQRSVALDPTATTVETANSWIAELQGAGVTPSVESAPSEGDTTSEDATTAP